MCKTLDVLIRFSIPEASMRRMGLSEDWKSIAVEIDRQLEAGA